MRYGDTVSMCPPAGYNASMTPAKLVYIERWTRKSVIPPYMDDKMFYPARPELSSVIYCWMIHTTHRASMFFNTADVKFLWTLVWLIAPIRLLLTWVTENLCVKRMFEKWQHPNTERIWDTASLLANEMSWTTWETLSQIFFLIQHSSDIYVNPAGCASLFSKGVVQRPAKVHDRYVPGSGGLQSHHVRCGTLL